ncbi:hypothetical protein HYV81_05565 [Candidatus Woesearchaeota archaeon]|nr:hypothetical protein [Candidatus Woesearchaeota archaeon]
MSDLGESVRLHQLDKSGRVRLNCPGVNSQSPVMDGEVRVIRPEGATGIVVDEKYLRFTEGCLGSPIPTEAKIVRVPLTVAFMSDRVKVLGSGTPEFYSSMDELQRQY